MVSAMVKLCDIKNMASRKCIPKHEEAKETSIPSVKTVRKYHIIIGVLVNTS